MTTWSPALRFVTPGPTASITPAPSWPSTMGGCTTGLSPSMAWRSDRQTPDAARRTTTSPAMGSSTLTSSILSASLMACSTAARMDVPLLVSPGHGWPALVADHRCPQRSRSGLAGRRSNFREPQDAANESSVEPVAGVDVERLSGHRTRSIRGEEQHRLRHLDPSGDAPQRHPPCCLADDVVQRDTAPGGDGLVVLLERRAPDLRRHDAVDPDIVPSALRRQRAGRRQQRRL